ncbi:MAG: ribosome biogenesis GTPase Der [Rickettsiales bacterium]|nr:ribosome biogenesis GTPase Der [Rickettsiales bacterium]MCA0254023.1 ribosome biogenesis GTPase Der [Pseudomonadota bacterium]
MLRKKIIALVGRPNVGKSTLFNRLSISKKAIVHDKPGVTRDRKYSDARLGPLEFVIIDTPGLEESEEGKLEHRMMQQTIIAMKEADLVCLVIDNEAGITPADKFFAEFIRKNASNYLVIANKSEKNFNHDKAYYKIGFGDPIPVSAEHGLGLNNLYEAFSAKLDNIKDIITEDPITSDSLQIVVTGRPNAGKSTFINSILGDERLLTGPEAGITRESIEVIIDHKGKAIKLIDTAGLRKRAKVTENLEKLSTGDAINSIKYANTVILMLDATNALEHQDLNIANYTIEQGRSIVIAVNKWDLVQNKKEFINEFEYLLEKNLPQVKGVPVVYLSATEGGKTSEVLDRCLEIYSLWNKKIATSKLNDWLQFAIERHPLPLHKKLGRRVRIKYITQVKNRPPTFKLFSNDPKSVSDAYRRYLLNTLREDFKMPGVPIRMNYDKSDNPYAKSK